MKENIGEYSVLSVRESAYFFQKLIKERITERNHLQKIKSETIDQTDKRILQQLNESSRKTYVEIGEKVNLTPNAIKQRVKNLEKTGIIQGYSLSLMDNSIDYNTRSQNYPDREFWTKYDTIIRILYILHTHKINVNILPQQFLYTSYPSNLYDL